MPRLWLRIGSALTRLCHGLVVIIGLHSSLPSLCNKWAGPLLCQGIGKKWTAPIHYQGLCTKWAAPLLRQGLCKKWAAPLRCQGLGSPSPDLGRLETNGCNKHLGRPNSRCNERKGRPRWLAVQAGCVVLSRRGFIYLFIYNMLTILHKNIFPKLCNT